MDEFALYLPGALSAWGFLFDQGPEPSEIMIVNESSEPRRVCASVARAHLIGRSDSSQFTKFGIPNFCKVTARPACARKNSQKLSRDWLLSNILLVANGIVFSTNLDLRAFVSDLSFSGFCLQPDLCLEHGGVDVLSSMDRKPCFPKLQSFLGCGAIG